MAFVLFRSAFNVNGVYKFEKAIFWSLGLMISFPVLLNFVPVADPLPPVLKRAISDAFTPTVSGGLKAIRIVIPEVHTAKQSSFNLLNDLYLLPLLGFVIWLISFVKDLRVINSMVKKSFLMKKYGKIHLYVCPDLNVPCSFWVPSKYFVLFPESVLLNKKLFTHALSHELQHHRQGDTQFIYFLELLKALFYLNPFTPGFRKDGQFYKI